jgi:hypothetical protein|tara:strand:- start:460 stop:756 length:297 start_codon:yes stop_codon:yes gene_type:complete
MSELTKEELKALKEAQKNLYKKKSETPRDTMLYKGDPILNKYMKRDGGYDFSNITKKDREYLEKKKKMHQATTTKRSSKAALRLSSDKKFTGHSSYKE